MNLRLSFWRTIFILSGDMKHQRRAEVLCFGETLLDTHAVISDGAIRLVAHRQEVSEISAETESDSSYSSVARGMRAQESYRCRCIIHSLGFVQAGIKRKSLLPF